MPEITDTKIPAEAASLDIAAEKRKQLCDLLPEAFSDGKLDIAALKRALGENAVVESGERYALTWAGKGDAYKVLQTPTIATLQPQRDLSVNFDEAQHLYIEGENLEVLKVLQKAYFGEVKLIYIDPPYNTGSDTFIYPDRFQESREDYLRRINELTDDGTLMREGFFQKNSKENGRFHSNWLSMMLPRLYIARNLLRDDGVLFVSIDDNEVHNLRCLLNEIFGEENFIGAMIWKSRHNVDSRNKTGFSSDHEYILAYGQKITGQAIDEDKYSNPDNDPRGSWMSDNMVGLATKFQRPNLHYDLENPETGIFYPCTEKGWRYDKRTMAKKIAEGRILWPANPIGRPRHKKFLNEVRSRFTGFSSILDAPNTSKGTQEIRELFGFSVFDFPKPVDLIRELVRQGSDEDSIVMDFFSGSAPLAQATIELNSSEGGDRQFICVQLPEKSEEDTEAYKADYKTIADIGRERIRRVIEKLKANSDATATAPSNLGFKSFQLTPSNFKQWRGDVIDGPESLAAQIDIFVKSEKDGAETENILYELLLKLGQPLTIPIEHLEIGGAPVHAINERAMLFVLECFTLDMIEPLIALKPREIVALDSIFHDSDELKSNLDLQCRDADVRFICI